LQYFDKKMLMSIGEKPRLYIMRQLVKIRTVA
jgi:hypothetical protein